jgi:hypothetical protein
MAYHNDWEGVRRLLELWSEKGLLRERDRIMLMIKYVARTHEVDRRDFEKLLEQYDPGGDIMPVADIYIEEGRKEGIKEGRQEGRISEKRQVLTRLLSARFRLNPSDEKRILAQEDPDRLDRAIDAVLFASTKDEVLRELE